MWPFALPDRPWWKRAGVGGSAALASVGPSVRRPLYFLGNGFPWGTLFINLSGSLFLGWFATVLTERLPNLGGRIHPDDLRLTVAVGFTGAYTTFSTYELESQKLLADGKGLLAMTYLFGSVILGLLAVGLGVFLARRRAAVP